MNKNEKISSEKLAEWKMKNDSFTGLIVKCGNDSQKLVDRLVAEQRVIVQMGECQRMLDMAAGKAEKDPDLVEDSLLAYCLGIIDERPAEHDPLTDTWREETLNKVIDECKKRLANPDAYEFEIVDLESEFRRALEKKERERNGKTADEKTYFSPGARFILGRGEHLRFIIAERNMLYAMDCEGNEAFTFTSPGCKIEAQQMHKFIFQAFPTLTPGLAGLMDYGDDTIPALYGYDYFLCGRDIVLCGPETVCKQVMEIIWANGVEVDALPLDKAWLIYEPTCESEAWPKLSDYQFVKDHGVEAYWEQFKEETIWS